MKEKHQKHAKLTRPNVGNFSRSEWAIIGTPCGNIQNLAKKIAEKLTPQYKVGYVDADHKAGDVGANLTPFAAEYTDKIEAMKTNFIRIFGRKRSEICPVVTRFVVGIYVTNFIFWRQFFAQFFS